MDVCFVYTNVNGFHYEAYHFGLASIVAVTREAGHNAKVSIIETEDDIPSVVDEIVSIGPKVIGFTSVSSQYGFIKQVAAQLKQRLPDPIIVCGGVHPTISPDALLESDDIDGFFIGESEFSFVEFLDNIENGKPYEGTDNYAYKLNGLVKRNKKKPLIDNLDVLPFPDREAYPYESTLKKVGYAPFFFSRGCPFLCTYCANHALAEVYGLKTNPVRDRSPESCIQEIEFVISKYDVGAISVEDDVFGLNKKWRREFLKLYKERIQPKNIDFQCLLRVELASEDFIRELKEAGCTLIFFGVESGDEEMRKTLMARKMSNQTIIEAFDRCRKHGIATLAVNIIGMPGETKKQIWNTIKLNRRLKATISAVNIFYPYKGTVLGDMCFAKGLVDEDKYRTFSNERRDTVLNFPEDHRQMLLAYHKDWNLLVNPFNLKAWTVWMIERAGLVGPAQSLRRQFHNLVVWVLKNIGLFERAKKLRHQFNNLWAQDHVGELKGTAKFGR